MTARNPNLTRRELQCARLAAQGLCNKEIARRLGLSPHTVKIYLHQAYRKLGARGRHDLAALLPQRRGARSAALIRNAVGYAACVLVLAVLLVASLFVDVWRDLEE